MTKTISLVPSAVSLVSGWSGYPDGHGGTTYTTPTVDGAAVTLTLNEEFHGVRFESAHLAYTMAGDGGNFNLRYLNSSVSVTNENLLERLKAGEREIKLYFTFRASGGSGGTGRFSACRSVTNIALTLTYVPVGGVSGTLVSGGRELSYSCDAASLAPGEETVLTLLSDADSGTLTVSGKSFPLTFAGGRAEVTLAFDELDQEERVTSAVLSADLVSGGETVTFSETETALKLVKTRLAPAVSVEFTDENGWDAVFGALVEGESAPRAVLTAVTDTEADSGVSVTDRTFTVDGLPVPLTADGADIGSLSAGSHPWAASVTDSFGLTGTASGTLTLLPYEAPAVTAFEVQRCSVSYDGEGHETAVQDDGSPQVWLTLNADISSVAGENAWSTDLVFSGSETITLSGILSGADGGEVRLSCNRVLLEDTLLDVTKGYTVSLVIRDAFHEKTFTCPDVPSAGGILNIEKGGVAVGMRSTGSKTEPLFECGYPAVFRSEVSFPGMDSGWQTLTMSGVSSGGLSVRSSLGMVFLRGSFRLSAALSSGASGSDAGRLKVAALPAGLSGGEAVYPVILDKSSGYLRLVIAQNGDIRLENRSGYAVGTNVDIAVNVSWI